MTDIPDADWVIEQLDDLTETLSGLGDMEAQLEAVGLDGKTLPALFMCWVLDGHLDGKQASGYIVGLMIGWLMRERWSFALHH